MDSHRERFDRATSGDEVAIEELLAQHLPRLRAFIRLRAGPRLRALEESQDLAQSVCREVLQHLGRFQYRSERGFRAWLFTTALRKLANRREYYAADRRDVARQCSLDVSRSGGDGALLELYGAFVTPSQDAAGKEELRRVERAFDQLDPDSRDVILLARIVGLQHREIAERMGRTERAVANLLYRAMARLSEKLVERP